jgi:lipopolysaccharide export system protein LptA
VIRTCLAALLIAVSLQEPAPGPGTWFGPIRMKDTETGEYVGDFSGFGNVDLAKESGTFERAHVRYFTQPKKNQPSHTIHLFANRCMFEGVGRVGDRGKAKFHFTESLRVFVDDDVRLWTPEGTFDYQTLTLTCPRKTRLVRFRWPPEITLAAALVFMDPHEMEWLRLFGAPEPIFEFSGDDFVYDAGADVFTAGKNGQIKVRGRLDKTFGKPERVDRPAKSVDPTELRCEGPLQVRNLGAPEADGWKTLHVTADKNVVVESRGDASTTRIRSDRASIYLSVPPSQEKAGARPISAVFSGSVKITESRGLDATGDRLEWNRQDDLVRLSGAPRVEISQGPQVLRARDVIIDRLRQTVDFKGDIVATFAGDRDALTQGKPPNLMTMKPGELQIRTDPAGRPVFVHAWNGVVLSSPTAAPGQEPLSGEGREFEWDLASGEGCLRGAPFATLKQGPNFVVGPLVTFRGQDFTKSLMVIKGPKVMRFFSELPPPPNAGEALAAAAMGFPGFRRLPAGLEPTLNSSATLLEAALGLRGFQQIPGRAESVMDLVATCQGDAVLDRQGNSVKLVDSCSVRAQDSTLNADVLFVYLTEDGGGLDRVVGLGRVRAYQERGPGGVSLEIKGETLELRNDPTGQRAVTVVGHPVGRATQGSMEMHFVRMTYNLSEKVLEAYKVRKR